MLVKLDLPNLGKNEEAEVAGLGIFQNGKTKEVSEADLQRFKDMHGKTVKQAKVKGLSFPTDEKPTVPPSDQAPADNKEGA